MKKWNGETVITIAKIFLSLLAASVVYGVFGFEDIIPKIIVAFFALYAAGVIFGSVVNWRVGQR